MKKDVTLREQSCFNFEKCDLYLPSKDSQLLVVHSSVFRSFRFALVVPWSFLTKKLNEIVKFEICILSLFSGKQLKCEYRFK